MTWLLGVIGILAAWPSTPGGPERVVVVIGLGAALFSAFAIIMEKDEPLFLATWLGRPGLSGWVGRFLVLCMWMQPAALPAIFVLVIGSGSVDAVKTLLVVECSAVFFVGLGLVCSRMQNMSHLVYFFTAALSLGLFAFLLNGASFV